MERCREGIDREEEVDLAISRVELDSARAGVIEEFDIERV